jgi:hypothetical protein
MTLGEYLVYPMSGHQWGVQYEGRFLARFATKSQAIQAAITIASASQPTVPTSVIVEANGGERYPVWSYGRDGYVSAA